MSLAVCLRRDDDDSPWMFQGPLYLESMGMNREVKLDVGITMTATDPITGADRLSYAYGTADNRTILITSGSSGQTSETEEHETSSSSSSTIYAPMKPITIPQPLFQSTAIRPVPLQSVFQSSSSSSEDRVVIENSPVVSDFGDIESKKERCSKRKCSPVQFNSNLCKKLNFDDDSSFSDSDHDSDCTKFQSWVSTETEGSFSSYLANPPANYPSTPKKKLLLSRYALLLTPKRLF